MKFFLCCLLVSAHNAHSLALSPTITFSSRPSSFDLAGYNRSTATLSCSARGSTSTTKLHAAIAISAGEAYYADPGNSNTVNYGPGE